ncbi:Stromal cell-derived factor 2-like protein 1 [Mortierella sp. AD011]|nr:Stromal cell-derived factor 2-like protein 1 [Mortierella sp. AD011]
MSTSTAWWIVTLKMNPPAYSPGLDGNYIEFGSKICLRHFKTGGLLRATDLRYKSLSFQHVVYSTHSREPILDDLWEVVAPKDAKGINRHLKHSLAYGSRIRLFNVSYKRWLHSHMIGAPVTANHREVTGYGNTEKSDGNDHWIVERAEEGTDLWKNSDVFILRHEASDYYLHSRATLFSGEMEVSACSGRDTINNLWRAQIQ